MSRKFFILVIIVICSWAQARAQVAYYDALTLRRHTNASGLLRKTSDSVYIILAKYIPVPAGIDSVSFITGRVDKVDNVDPNPFLEISKGAEASGKVKQVVSQGLSALGGLDVTTIANGIASFMIERSKQELTIAFFNRFKKFVEENPEFKVLFPKTTDNLDNLLAYKYPEMIPALRNGFFEDLRSLTYHIDDVLELPRYQELLKNFPEIRVAIRSIRLIHEIESGYSHPAETLDKFARFKEFSDTLTNSDFQNFGNTIKLAAIFSNSLRNSSTLSDNPTEKKDIAKVWVSFSELQKLIQDRVTFRIYLGLIYEQCKNENIRWVIYKEIGKSTKKETEKKTYIFTEIMAAQQTNLFLFENKVTEFIELANKVDNTLDSLDQKKKGNISITKDDYYNYINVSLDVIDYGYSIADIFIDNEKFVASDYTKIARKSNDLYRHIYREEYTQAISSTMDIYSTIKVMLDSNKAVMLKKIKATPGSAITTSEFDKLDTTNIKERLKSFPELRDKTIALYSSKETIDNNFSDFIAGATKYGLFLANLVDAKSEEEVQAVLEAATLPVGSSSIKKNSRWNAAVQSYLGAYASFTDPPENVRDRPWNDKWGVIAPIGISLSYGFRKAGSASLFVSLLDLGAIVDYKLRYDTIQTNATTDVAVSKDYKVDLGQIFSPGVFAVYGFPWNLPLSLGIGAQYGPGLNKIESSGNTVVDNPYWRVNAFLAVDIPFFNIFNKQRKR